MLQTRMKPAMAAVQKRLRFEAPG